MKNSALAILTALALLAFPLAAQVPEEENPPIPEQIEESAEQVEQAAQEIQEDAEQLGQEVEQEAEELGQEIEQEIDEAVDTEDPAATSNMDDDDALPQTAGPLAALILLGLAGAGSAFGIRVARRK